MDLVHVVRHKVLVEQRHLREQLDGIDGARDSLNLIHALEAAPEPPTRVWPDRSAVVLQLPCPLRSLSSDPDRRNGTRALAAPRASPAGHKSAQYLAIKPRSYVLTAL